MHGLVYISAPDANISEGAVQEILAKARDNNERLGITGLLLFSGYLFVQVLEGPADTLDNMMKTIANDPRHDDVTILSREPIESRIYSDWTMAFRHIDQTSMNQLCGEIGWDTAMKKLNDVPHHRTMAFLTKSIISVVGHVKA